MYTLCQDGSTTVNLSAKDKAKTIRQVEIYETDQGPELTVTTGAGNVYTMPLDKLAMAVLHFGNKL